MLVHWNEKSVNDRNTQRNIDRFDVLMSWVVAYEPCVKVDTNPRQVVAKVGGVRLRHHSCYRLWKRERIRNRKLDEFCISSLALI